MRDTKQELEGLVPYALTELQIAIMAVLWERGEANVADVHDALRRSRRVAQSTVATLLGRLEERGVVDHRVDGRQYIYKPLVDEASVHRSLVQEFAELSRPLFTGNLPALVSYLLETTDVDPSDLARARAILDARQRELEAERGDQP